MHDETFGPITPILAIDSLDEAIGIANDSRYGPRPTSSAATTTPSCGPSTTWRLARYISTVRSGNRSMPTTPASRNPGSAARTASGAAPLHADQDRISPLRIVVRGVSSATLPCVAWADLSARGDPCPSVQSGRLGAVPARTVSACALPMQALGAYQETSVFTDDVERARAVAGELRSGSGQERVRPDPSLASNARSARVSGGLEGRHVASAHR